MIINTGGRDVVIQKFAVRGQTVTWSNVYYGSTTQAVAADLTYQGAIAAGNLAIGTVQVTMAQASDSLTLRSGYSMVLYINSPDSITINDVGLTVSITLNTAQAMYYVETNVQTTDGTTTVSNGGGNPITITPVYAWYSISDKNQEIAFAISNTGSTNVTMSWLLTVNGSASTYYTRAAVGTFTVSSLSYVLGDNIVGGFILDGRAFYPVVTGVEIPSGQTAIVYNDCTSSNFNENSGGQPVTVVVAFEDLSNITVTPTVQVIL